MKGLNLTKAEVLSLLEIHPTPTDSSGFGEGGS